jgi:hypothetical protein
MVKEGKLISSSHVEKTLNALANPVGLKLFILVATASLAGTSRIVTSEFLHSQIRTTRKQFYSNMSRLVNDAGLVSRKRGHYVLSNYGKVVFHSLNLTSRAAECFWALKALDKDELSSSGIPLEQIMEIGASLIDDKDIFEIIFESDNEKGKA